MLRAAATKLRRVQGTPTTRSITSAQKRAIKKEQITPSSASSDATTKFAKPPTATVPPPPSSSSSASSGGSLAPAILGFTALGVGGAYYMDMIPSSLERIPVLGSLISSPKDESEEKVVPVTDIPADKKEEEAKEETTVTATETEPVKDEEKKEEPEEEPTSDTAPTSMVQEGGNRVLNITAPDNKGRKSEPMPEKGHVEGGNRVSVETFRAINGRGDALSTSVSGEELKPDSNDYQPVASLAIEAEKELTSSVIDRSMIDEELAKAHALMKATVDETYLQDLDTSSSSNLKIRVIQLASEMNERAKWEAVRLKEFLAMKEKEVGEKYMGQMQKQRFEYEDLLARRLREQEGTITRAANEAMEAKDKSIEAVVNATASAQQAEYEAALSSNTELLQAKLSAQYEADFGTKLAEKKAAMVSNLEKKVAAIEELSNRLQQAEQNLQISRNFESGSQRAHRVSAAALALAEKMESNKGAIEEFAALKAAAVENGVIASALEQIPASLNAGIPTLPELQAKFDSIYQTGREAAYVPSGRSGIGAQMAGKAFASLSGAPSPDTAPPVDDEGKMADYILARAKRYVQLGDLEKAVGELDHLKGQTAFTINDWKSSAKDRIAVKKALNVIKMECALLNKNMGG